MAAGPPLAGDGAPSNTFDCLRGVSYMEEQFYIMKPEEVVTRSFYLYPTTDQAARYECAAILKASDFSEADRAECQFTTTATIHDNGSQIVTDYEPKKIGINGFFESIKSIWKTAWQGLLDFFTGKTCRSRCSSFFDFGCHIQYICASWILMFSLLLAIFPTAIVLLWLLHQKGFFDPLYDWWDDRFASGTQSRTHLKQQKQDIRERRARRHHEDDDYYHQKRKKHKSDDAFSHHHHHRHHPSRHDAHIHVHKERPNHRHYKGPGIDGAVPREVGPARGPRKSAVHYKERHGKQKLVYG